MAQHELKSKRTADEIESRVQMYDDVLRFTASSPATLPNQGDGAIVTSSDGCVFIGEVYEVDPETGKFTVTIS